MYQKKYLIRFPTLALMVSLTAIASCRSDALSADDVRAKASAAPIVEYKGQHYAIIDGAAYKMGSKEPKFVKRLYDPDFYSKNYEIIAAKIYRKDADGVRHPVVQQLTEGFEAASGIHDLIGPARGWSSMTLLSPGASSVKEYVRLRSQILQGKGHFIDNRVEPSATLAHSGKKALRLYAVPPSIGMSITKATLDTELLHFKKGDDVWFAGWFYIAKGRPVGLLDLESSFIDEGPGMRLLLSDALQPRLELKWGDKPSFHAEPSALIPVGKWVHIRLHLALSDGNDGRAQLWIDSNKVIDAAGQTLPLPDTVYDRMQVGITANPKDTTTELFLDDVIVTDKVIP